MCLDLLVHQGLGKARLVALVVPVAPVTDQIDHEILVELLAVCKGRAYGFQAGRRVIRIDVQDRDFKSLGQVAGVQRTAAFIR